MDWCRTNVSQLIEKYREHPILWDVRCTDEKNKNLKAEALEEIARSLHISVEEVVKKLNSLKVQFSRENCRVRREKQRTGRTYTPKWYGYEQLLFLKDSNTRQKKWIVKDGSYDSNDYTNFDDLSVTSPNSIKEEFTPLENETEAISSPRPSSIPRLENNFLNSPPMTQNPMSQYGICDEFMSYGLYIASKLRSLNDPYLRAIAKYNINKVIFNVELKQCEGNENRYPTTSTESNYQNHMEPNLPR